MLNVVSQCAGLFPTDVGYERHSRALFDRLEVFVEVPEDKEMVKETCVQKYVGKGQLVEQSLLECLWSVGQQGVM